MREFTKVYKSVWTSKKFRTLDDDSKLVYLYLLTSPQNNSAGCFDLSIGFALDHLGWPPERFRKAIDSLSIVYLIAFDEDEKTVLLTNWFNFNCPTNPKHARGTVTALDAVSSLELKGLAVEALNEALTVKNFFNDIAFRKAMESLSEDYRKAIATKTKTKTKTQNKTKTKTKTETKTKTNRTVDVRARDPEGARASNGNGPHNEVEEAEAAYAADPTPENWNRLQSKILERNGEAKR